MFILLNYPQLKNYLLTWHSEFSSSPALERGIQSPSSEYYYATETSTSSTNSAAPPRRDGNLNPNAAQRLGQVLGLGIGQEIQQNKAAAIIPRLPEWPILVEWVCNSQPVRVFRDVSGVFAFASLTASTANETIVPAQSPFLSTTNINMDLTWVEILDRLELSRSITGERANGRSWSLVAGDTKKLSLVFKSLRLRFDIAGGKHGEIDLVVLENQEMRDVWKLVRKRGLRDHMVVEYSVRGKREESGKEISKITTTPRQDDRRKGFQIHQNANEMHGAQGAITGFRARVKSALMDISPKRGTVGPEVGRGRSLRRSLHEKRLERRRVDGQESTIVV